MNIAKTKNPLYPARINHSLKEIISIYKDNTRIRSIKELFQGPGFSMPTANEVNIFEILVSVNPKNATGNDLIPSKVVIESLCILSNP